MPRKNRKLTETEIRNAKPKDKDYFLFDEASLRLLIRPSGTKTWQLPYKFNGKNNIHTIGKYGPNANQVSTTEARPDGSCR
ncbi:MAG: Arm DNA-binding domain-containing protein [Alphaproteobacteria bacterium]